MQAATTDRRLSERGILFVVGAVQFVNILDFMMVAPLGPRLAIAVDMPESNLAYAVAAYTFAAAAAGLLGSLFLDRFDRRPALAIALLGLALGTAAGSLASNFTQLIAARMLAGVFGGPATSLALAIVSDVIPAERRGRAMGAVMGAFAAASVLGVPLGIALAEIGGWHLPFIGVGAMGLVVVVMVLVLLPPLRGHLDDAVALRGAGEQLGGLVTMLRRPLVLSSYAMTFTVNAAAFVLMPNIATYLQNNLGLPESQLKWLYLSGGVVSFFTTRAAGVLVDRAGSARVALVGSLGFALVTWAGFARTDVLPFETALLPCMFVLFATFMFSNGVRNVAYTTLTTRVPAPEERARFMSLQSAVQHVSAAAGASLSAHLLTTDAHHRLVGMPTLAWLSIGLSVLLPLLVRNVQRQLPALRP
ncbi:MAG: MFS transporter [Deltaproteobacteria bacterium]|nr:MFS transporter [Nannocystaceae bacterium]